MPTVITKTVKPNGGGDYLSLQAALVGEAALRANLVGLDQALEIACYAGRDTTPVAVAGFTTDATHYVRIYCPAGEGHGGLYDLTGISRAKVPAPAAHRCASQWILFLR